MFEENDCDINALAGLALIYNGREVEGEIIHFEEKPQPKWQEVILSIGGKKYRTWLEELPS